VLDCIRLQGRGFLMTIDHEKILWNALAQKPHECQPFAHDVISELVSADVLPSAKAAYATLEKWSRQGCWDYGTGVGSGWKTGKTPERLKTSSPAPAHHP